MRGKEGGRREGRRERGWEGEREGGREDEREGGTGPRDSQVVYEWRVICTHLTLAGSVLEVLLARLSSLSLTLAL